jgi:hypothetical protein
VSQLGLGGATACPVDHGGRTSRSTAAADETERPMGTVGEPTIITPLGHWSDFVQVLAEVSRASDQALALLLGGSSPTREQVQAVRKHLRAAVNAFQAAERSVG